VLATWNARTTRLLTVDPDTGAVTPLFEIPDSDYYSELAVAPDGVLYLGSPWSIARVDPQTRTLSTVASRPRGAAASFRSLEAVPLPPPSGLRVDVRPRSRRNRIVLGLHRPLPVAILSSEAADASRVDLASLAFGPAGAAPLANPAPGGDALQWIGDLNRDGRDDVLFFFDPDAAGLEAGAAEVCLDGLAERRFRECDRVLVSSASSSSTDGRASMQRHHVRSD